LSAELNDISEAAYGYPRHQEIFIQTGFVFYEKPIYDIVKRAFDIVFSLTAIIILFPFLILIAAAIMIDDFGNPIFIQKRVGKNRKEFWMLKFRSMYKNAENLRMELQHLNEADGPLFKIKEDPRITRVGRFIRRTSLDELPQLFNVLHGSMSIIGPRPFVTHEQEKMNEYQYQRLLVKPGLSCIWQISGRNDVSFNDLIELDLEYIQKRNMFLDIELIFKTIITVVLSKGAY